mmetsp:Transcript_86217/g.222052  ORF Transcript_86217/g.222052 Transcript_86217/m.222052 type:complete len:244 (-) Transcript_86217:1127-1858(-)
MHLAQLVRIFVGGPHPDHLCEDHAFVDDAGDHLAAAVPALAAPDAEALVDQAQRHVHHGDNEPGDHAVDPQQQAHLPSGLQPRQEVEQNQEHDRHGLAEHDPTSVPVRPADALQVATAGACGGPEDIRVGQHAVHAAEGHGHYGAQEQRQGHLGAASDPHEEEQGERRGEDNGKETADRQNGARGVHDQVDDHEDRGTAGDYDVPLRSTAQLMMLQASGIQDDGDVGVWQLVLLEEHREELFV